MLYKPHCAGYLNQYVHQGINESQNTYLCRVG